MIECNSYRQKIELTVDFTLTLSKIPDSCMRVVVKNYEEMRNVEFTTNDKGKKEVVLSSIEPTKYFVDYLTGKIYFGSSIVGKTVTIIYYSREVE